MGFIIIFLIAIITYLLLEKPAEVTRIPVVLWLVVIGILFGPYGFYDIFSQIDSINTSVSELENISRWAVILLFLMSGIGLNIDALKKSGKHTIVLSILPAYVEGIVMGVVAYLIFLVLPISHFKFSLPFFLMVMLFFAMASPAIIIPLCFKGKKHYPKEKFYDEMIVASIMDNFTPVPLLIMFLTLGVTLSSGEAVDIFSTIITVLISIVGLVVAYFIGHFLGLIISKLAKVKNIKPIVIVILHFIITLVAVSLLGSLGATYGVVIGLGSGVGMNIGVKDEKLKLKISLRTHQIYTLLFMPTIFIYVGTKIQVDLLFNPMIVLSLALVTILAIIVKGFVSGRYLLSKKYSSIDAKLSGTFFAAKGIVLINMSLIVAAPLHAVGQDYVLQYMYILAAVATFISVPYSIIKSEKLLKQ